jgi:hypothetical protein
MKKLLLIPLLAWGMISIAFAQSDSKLMVAVGPRVFGPACTNCSALSGFGLSGGYALIDKMVATLDVGFYSRSEFSSKLKSTAIGISGDFYPKEAFRGFYVGPDITYIIISQDINGMEVFSETNITVGINLGWAIAIGNKFRIIPHAGYGTWFEDSKGRITVGMKVAYKI